MVSSRVGFSAEYTVGFGCCPRALASGGWTIDPWERAADDSNNHAKKGPGMRMLPSHSVAEGA